MSQVPIYNRNQVKDDEKLARIVLYPRDIDPFTQLPKHSFITLRSAEGGISFIRYDYLGRDIFLQKGKLRADLYNKHLKRPKYSFVGYMECIVSEIVSISPAIISVEIEDPDHSPEHVVVCFKKEGEIIKGIVTDAEILDIMDEIYHLLKYVKID